jgi:hypothetical protein
VGPNGGCPESQSADSEISLIRTLYYVINCAGRRGCAAGLLRFAQKLLRCLEEHNKSSVLSARMKKLYNELKHTRLLLPGLR